MQVSRGLGYRIASVATRVSWAADGWRSEWRPAGYLRVSPAIGTACWPCRQRKVKCDNKQPCDHCVKRDHVQLCSYKPNRPSVMKPGAADPESVAGKKRPHSPGEDEDQPQTGSDSRTEGSIRGK